MSKGAGLVRTERKTGKGTHLERGLGGKTTERRKKGKKEKWHLDRFAMCRKSKRVGSESCHYMWCKDTHLAEPDRIVLVLCYHDRGPMDGHMCGQRAWNSSIMLGLACFDMLRFHSEIVESDQTFLEKFIMVRFRLRSFDLVIRIFHWD